MLTDAQCHEVWETATKENPIVCGTPDGDQVMNYIMRVNADNAKRKTRVFEVGGFQPFVSPVDGKAISNSDDLSNHNREHNVQQVGNEYQNSRKEYLRERAEGLRADPSIVATTDRDVTQRINQLKER